MDSIQIRHCKQAMLVFLVSCVGLFSSACMRRTVATGLSETEAREVAVALSRGDIGPYVLKQPKGRDQEGDQWQVDINGGDATEREARKILDENSLPRPRDVGIEGVYTKDKQDLIPGASEERAKFILALGGEISKSLKSIPCVADARVHVVIPDSAAIRDPDDKPRSSASVLLKYWSTCAPPSMSDIEGFVANGVEGLDRNRISVMYAKLEPSSRKHPEELINTVRLTPGVIVDYGSRWGLFACALFGAYAVLKSFPTSVRWLQVQLQDLSDTVALISRKKE